jgi:hypothetical protein
MKNRQSGGRQNDDHLHEAARDAAQALAVQALAFLAAEPERMGRFLSMTGIGPADLRAAAGEPNFLAGVLEYLMGDEPLLVAFAEHAQVKPVHVMRAAAALGTGTWERDVP